jgi:hypothetical protein
LTQYEGGGVPMSKKNWIKEFSGNFITSIVLYWLACLVCIRVMGYMMTGLFLLDTGPRLGYYRELGCNGSNAIEYLIAKAAEL